MALCEHCSSATSWPSALKRAAFLAPCSECGQHEAWHCLHCAESTCQAHRSAHSLSCGHSGFLSPTGNACFCVQCEKYLQGWAKESDVPGNIGFKNLGSTCYMNVGLQCLLHTQPLLAYLSQVLTYVKLPESLASV